MIDIADDEARVVDDAALDGELFAVRRDEARGGRASLAGEKERGETERDLRVSDGLGDGAR